MLPFETILAVSPPSAEVKIGRFRTLHLKPITLTHIVALEAFGCSIDYNLERSQALIAAWFLSQKGEALIDRIIDIANPKVAKKLGKFIHKVSRKGKEIQDVVNRHIEISFKTYVPGKKSGSGTELMGGAPEGYGWPLEIAEHLCGEYGWTFEKAMCTPIARALALVSVGRIRLGGDAGGPDYYQRLAIDKMKASGLFKAIKKK